IRPRVKSYGESSTATLSPARIRMKFLRILPETCARTWCLFSSSTRNIAFGSGSMTVAMTSMASSLGFPESPFFFSSNCFAISSCVHGSRAKAWPLRFLPRWPGHPLRPRQDPRPIGRDRDGVLEMRRGAAIRRLRHPLIAHANFRAASVHHGLNGDDHSFLQPSAASRLAIVRQVRLVVHPGANAMTDELPHHGKTVLLDPALHCVANITEPVAGAHLADASVQRLPG